MTAVSPDGGTRGDSGTDNDEIRSYHGQPLLKEPVWTWEIPCYFFTGGLAGASAGLAYLSGLRGNEALARRAWATSLVGIGVSPALLISDLGVPSRFLNMLRMFKVTSPMSVGSWILSVSGAATSVAAANAWLGLFPKTARLARPVAALFGLPLCTYTAALVANTAVPVWHEGRRMLPFVFGTGAALSAGAAAVIITPVADAAPARRLALLGAVTEIAGKEAMERGLGELGQAYREGSAGRWGHIGRACLVAGTALLARRGSSSRAAAVGAGGLLMAGAWAARWSVFRAGFNSVSDPRYVVGQQRGRITRGLRRGAARREPRVAVGDHSAGSPATAG